MIWMTTVAEGMHVRQARVKTKIMMVSRPALQTVTTMMRPSEHPAPREPAVMTVAELLRMTVSWQMGVLAAVPLKAIREEMIGFIPRLH